MKDDEKMTEYLDEVIGYIESHFRLRQEVMMNKVKIEMPGYVEGTNLEADKLFAEIAIEIQEMLERGEYIEDEPPISGKESKELE